MKIDYRPLLSSLCLIFLAGCSSPLQPIPRSQWCRVDVSSTADVTPMNGIQRITIHHDGLPPTTLTTPEAIQQRIVQIRNYHLSRGWADIGYHYIIDPLGQIWEARSLQWQGAHVRGHNEHNMGILMLGNFMEAPPTPAAQKALRRWLKQQQKIYCIPDSQIFTHGELGDTECPGACLQQVIDSWR